MVVATTQYGHTRTHASFSMMSSVVPLSTIVPLPGPTVELTPIGIMDDPLADQAKTKTKTKTKNKIKAARA